MQSHFGSDPTIEYLCDRFAAALLLPRQLFLQSARHLGLTDQAQVPFLHLIPQLAERFRVGEQAVARRLFFHLLPRSIAILCIQQKVDSVRGGEAQRKWKTSWCALPADLHQRQMVAGLRIPLEANGRVIPNSMIPHVRDGLSVECELDSRWWRGLQAQPERQSRQPFSLQQGEGGHIGFVGRVGDSLYIAHPV